MLDYVPIDLATCNSAPSGHEWADAWRDEDKPGENSQTVRLIAVSSKTTVGAICESSLVGPLPQDLFQPERISGYCASY